MAAQRGGANRASLDGKGRFPAGLAGTFYRNGPAARSDGASEFPRINPRQVGRRHDAVFDAGRLADGPLAMAWRTGAQPPGLHGGFVAA